jgi:hypothetical protein
LSDRAKLGANLNVLVLSPTPTHPQDFGNRKRIFRICKNLSDGGARITFVHYPAESEWRGRVPAAAERAMQQCWDHYYTVGPTRLLHTDPAGPQHRIDEWWDDAIGGFLRWIFSVQRIDVFIVNYSWLSKALEFAPPGTFRILDTHDKVSGRRDMLASLRLGPEFFYTDETEEAVALGRADLVWAIKDEERALFERMAPTPVITMPHLDPLTPLVRPAHDPDGYLRVGVIGARNNVNRMNITEFLSSALPLFEKSFAPVKIVIAGTVCDLLEDIHSPFVELRGRVGDAEEFYRTVDCVAVPMRASTGLKIKAGEALSLGVPLLSLAHAFEGYEPCDAAHSFADFKALATGLIDLAFAPRAALDALAEASRASHAKTAAKIDSAVAETIERAYGSANSIVLAVDSKAFVPGTILNHVLESVHEYLRDFGVLKVLVVRGDAADITGNERSAELLDRIFVADDVAGAGDQSEALSRLNIAVVNAKDYLAHTRPKILVADALHAAFGQTDLRHTIVLSRAEIIAFTEGRSATWLPGKGFKDALISAPGISREIAGSAASAGAATVALPCFRQISLGKIRSAQAVGDRRTLAVLGDPESPAVSMAVQMTRAWGMEPFVVCGLDSVAREVPTQGTPAVALKVDAYLDSLFSLKAARPHFALDLSRDQPGLGLCREILERLRIPLASGSRGGLHPSLVEDVRQFRAGTERELWTIVRTFALEPNEAINAQFLRAWNELEYGKGWAWFSRFCGELFGMERALAA